MTDARGQLSYAYAYDYLVVNDDLDSVLEQIKDIIHSCRLKTHHNKRRLDDITKTFYQEVR